MSGRWVQPWLRVNADTARRRRRENSRLAREIEFCAELALLDAETVTTTTTMVTYGAASCLCRQATDSDRRGGSATPCD